MRHLLLWSALALASCTLERQSLAVDARIDSALTAAGLSPLSLHKLKLTGPVTIQLGQGNTSTQVGTDKTGQRAQAVSTGANSPVTASQKRGSLPWWVFALVGVVSIVGWEWISHQGLLAWLPWRA